MQLTYAPSPAVCQVFVGQWTRTLAADQALFPCYAPRLVGERCCYSDVQLAHASAGHHACRHTAWQEGNGAGLLEKSFEHGQGYGRERKRGGIGQRAENNAFE